MGEEKFRLILAVAHHQQALDLLQLVQRKFCDFLQGHPSCIGNNRSAEGLPELRIVGDHIRNRFFDWMGCLFQTGLGGRAEQDRCITDLGQKLHGQIEKCQHPGRYSLNLVNDNDAAAESLEAADGSRPSVKESVEQLHQSRDDDRCIPAFHSQLPLIQFPSLLGVQDIGVVFQDDAVIPQILPDHGGILLQNGQQRRCEDQPAFPPFLSMSQRVAQRTQGFSAAGGNIQSIDPAFALRKGTTPIRDLPAGPTDGSVRGETEQLFLHTCQIRFPKFVQIRRCRCGPKAAHEFRCVPPVALDQCG